jgi:hypothetical protein
MQKIDELQTKQSAPKLPVAEVKPACPLVIPTSRIRSPRTPVTAVDQFNQNVSDGPSTSSSRSASFSGSQLLERIHLLVQPASALAKEV